jgi:ribosome-associated protein
MFTPIAYQAIKKGIYLLNCTFKIIRNMKTFAIDSEYIQLIRLLKASRMAQSGGEAQQLVVEGLVKVNGVLESRKRAKLRPGDVVEYNGQKVEITAEE